jgi:hypothetical protein
MTLYDFNLYIKGVRNVIGLILKRSRSNRQLFIVEKIGILLRYSKHPFRQNYH